MHSVPSNDWSSVFEANDIECAISLILCCIETLLDKHFHLGSRLRNFIPKGQWISRGVITTTHMEASLFKFACKSKTQDGLA